MTCCSGAFAQAITGTINGSVHDASGAAIAGAAVRIQDTVHNVQARSVQTDGSGNYSAPQLQPGIYAVTGTAQGFKSAAVVDVHLNVGDTLAVNLTLPVGSSTETVTRDRQRCSGEHAVGERKHADQWRADGRICR